MISGMVGWRCNANWEPFVVVTPCFRPFSLGIRLVATVAAVAAAAVGVDVGVAAVATA